MSSSGMPRTVIDLESFVEQDHLLRKIDRVLDTAFVRDSTAACYADGLGRPSVDPEVYFRMQLVAYLYGISSERQLCEDVHYHLAYRWFCRLSLEDLVPDHSSLTRIRDRLGGGGLGERIPPDRSRSAGRRVWSTRNVA